MHLHGEAGVNLEGGWKVNWRARGMSMAEEGDQACRVARYQSEGGKR